MWRLAQSFGNGSSAPKIKSTTYSWKTDFNFSNIELKNILPVWILQVETEAADLPNKGYRTIPERWYYQNKYFMNFNSNL